MADLTDDAFIVMSLLALCLLFLGVWHAVATFSKARRQRKSMAGAKPLPVRPSATVGSRRPARLPVRRRVISLHSSTPGQARHEYNIGDNQGTRGSALVRAA